MPNFMQIIVVLQQHNELPLGNHASIQQLTLKGRAACALGKLLEAGERGCPPIETPGPRWADYVFKIRRAGLDVETIDEKHAGAFSGTHARYVLRSPMTVLTKIAA